ncbi:MAG: phosphate signaling complex protein PhoU [Sandaracinaceae bacterium]|nr:phosphate signaling complex protein PhoU [Sandaracinaceae bacterium]
MTAHTSRAYEQELAELQRRLVAMGARCEELIEMAARAMGERDGSVVARVEEADRAIDRDEMEIDELTVRILALRQPAARDLRFLVFALKVVTDLERIGDEASNMAERAAQLAGYGHPAPELQPKVEEMAKVTRALVHQALDAFVQGDEALARAVREARRRGGRALRRGPARQRRLRPAAPRPRARRHVPGLDLEVPRAHRGSRHEHRRDGRLRDVRRGRAAPLQALRCERRGPPSGRGPAAPLASRG